MPDYSHAVPSSWRWFTNQCAQLGAPKTHALFVPRAQARPTHSSPVKGSKSPSKFGLQAPNTAGPASVWCLDLLNPIYKTTQKAGPKRAETHDKRETSLPAPISKYMLGTSRSVTWLWNPMQRTVLNRHRRNKCNQSPALLPNQVQVHPTHSARSPIIHIYLYSMW
jgi:hypothetical protein